MSRQDRKNQEPDQLGIVKILIVVALILAVIILVAEKVEEGRVPATEPSEPIVTTEDTSPTIGENFKLQKMTYAEMAMGDLVLVNAQYGIDPGYVALENLYENAAQCYYVADMEIEVQEKLIEPLNAWMTEFYDETGINDTLVVAGHRTVEYQQELYDNAVETKGQAHADAYLALPGRSEHHTGLAIDFDTYTDQGILGGFDGEGEFQKILDSAWKYGFVQRYPPDKSDITGINYEAWHFRYVGLPHSKIMNDYDLCLEEYIRTLKAYPYEEEHLKVEYNGKSYEIYYSKGLEIPVPTDRSYTVSGNNVDGFIVTIEE